MAGIDRAAVNGLDYQRSVANGLLSRALLAAGAAAISARDASSLDVSDQNENVLCPIRPDVCVRL